MNAHELNRIYEQRIGRLQTFVFKLTQDDDLAQELRIGIYNALRRDPHGSDSYLKTEAKWNLIRSIRKGRSVDNGSWNRKALKIVYYDQIEDDELAANILKDMDRRPVDEQVIAKITFESFLSSLTELEKRLVQHRIVGWSFRKIAKKLEISKNRLSRMKKEIRFKINEAFAC